MREIWFCLLIVLSLGTLSPTPALAAAGDAAKELAVQPSDRILGKAEAPITIIEYASLTCPHCAHFDVTVLPKLKEKWIDTGKAKLILRDYPLDEPALRAAMVARCAPADRFYPLIDTFFAQQEQWATSRDYRAALEKLVKLGGMSDKEFKACISDKKLEDQVAQSRLVASQQLGVDATPTFFINGKKFDGAPTVEAFDQALSGAAPKS
ncbi:MAG: DsbA family protein [Alphaproteobacteria bacterium]|jgi:protein-disulfide isomerase|nr:MAG: DsbA family protein [Alphaproteobacteria bacterium]TMK11418.1 MAG: DsbA family protein [Alphaproteobacteria bacterium]TMK32458.1 MAG: DsbA family protein [Alphaproteobacteria bacterium]